MTVKQSIRSFINAVEKIEEMRYVILASALIAVLPLLILASIWLHGDYFKPKYANTTAIVTNEDSYHEIEANFRSTPGIEVWNIVSEVPEGTEVTLTGYLKYKPVRNFFAYLGMGRNDYACSFTQVIVNGKVGWIASRYLSVHPVLKDSAVLLGSLIALAFILVVWLALYTIYTANYYKRQKAKKSYKSKSKNN